MWLKPFDALRGITEPFVAKIHAVSSVGSCHQLEDRQWDAAGIHLLKDEAYGFLLIFLLQHNQRNVVVAKLIQHVSAERHVPAEFRCIMNVQSLLPLI